MVTDSYSTIPYPDDKVTQLQMSNIIFAPAYSHDPLAFPPVREEDKDGGSDMEFKLKNRDLRYYGDGTLHMLPEGS